MEKEKENSLLAMYEQHWLHARHAENHRLRLTQIFAFIFAGALAFIARGGINGIFNTKNVPLILLLIILSLFGIVYSLKIDMVYKAYVWAAEKIMEEVYELSEFDKPLGRPPFEDHWVRGLRVTGLYPVFFLLSLLFLWTFFLITISDGHLKGPIIITFVIMVITIGVSNTIYFWTLTFHPDASQEGTRTYFFGLLYDYSDKPQKRGHIINRPNFERFNRRLTLFFGVPLVLFTAAMAIRLLAKFG